MGPQCPRFARLLQRLHRVDERILHFFVAIIIEVLRFDSQPMPVFRHKRAMATATLGVWAPFS